MYYFWVVRYLLLIPALTLFLSYIPFVREMDMKEMMAVMKKSGCCKKEQKAGSCGKSEDAAGKNCGNTGESQRCGTDKNAGEPVAQCAAGKSQPAGDCGGEPDGGEPGKNQCVKQDATCVCICCFQYAAPDQFGVKLHFGIDANDNELAGYVQENWKDPQLMAPWQPPDMG